MAPTETQCSVDASNGSSPSARPAQPTRSKSGTFDATSTANTCESGSLFLRSGRSFVCSELNPFEPSFVICMPVNPSGTHFRTCRQQPAQAQESWREDMKSQDNEQRAKGSGGTQAQASLFARQYETLKQAGQQQGVSKKT